MSEPSTSEPGTYELAAGSAVGLSGRDGPVASRGLPEALLVRNALWFCRRRWVIIGILLAFGGLSYVPGLFAHVGWRPDRLWPLVVAAVLAVDNTAFRWHARRLAAGKGGAGARSNLWAQIVSDLVVLTVVVHFTGSLETHIPFAYLLHIVLACIFFSRPASLVVLGLACALYTGCVLVEWAGLVEPTGVYADDVLRRQLLDRPRLLATNVISAQAMWLVVWYLASRLSAMVRARDDELAEANRRLSQSLRERAEHMLRTTHELKAPFASIDANVQLLLKGHCGDLPDEAVEVLGRIQARSRRLAVEIQEMLQLANLRSASDQPPPPARLDLADVVTACLDQLDPSARKRGIVVEKQIAAAPVVGVEDHLRMLLGNVLANAVAYSEPGGRVRATCSPLPEGGARVTVRDDGIGIPADKLPHIFDEYYRTDEAVRHNRESSGLGLAIVRHVAREGGVRVAVTSRPGAGTTFDMHFPPRPPMGREARP